MVLSTILVMIWYASIILAYEWGGTNHENVKRLIKERDRAYDRYETYRHRNPPR